MAGDNVTGEGLWSAITSTKEGEQFLRELYRLQMYHDSAPAKEAINATDTVSNYERLAGDVDKDCKEHIGKIFERFYRIPDENSHRAEGSGLGLSIVKNAVAFHGGSISTSHVSPHGLCFKFSIPKL